MPCALQEYRKSSNYLPGAYLFLDFCTGLIRRGAIRGGLTDVPGDWLFLQHLEVMGCFLKGRQMLVN